MHGVWVYPFTAALRHPVGLAELQNESGTTSHMSGACLMVDDIWYVHPLAHCLCLRYLLFEVFIE